MFIHINIAQVTQLFRFTVQNILTINIDEEIIILAIVKLTYQI